ncbi:NF-kappa-B inhibitor cactus [Orussus abietinus]|uniref:NF-kappa-B inhibitor cactus n=1 Tax=Orussus abietinus TaxID=222816 RepID=UPI000625EFD6|nr:NF-kappa-B inhibitor cactus [Orussus abietinus]
MWHPQQTHSEESTESNVPDKASEQQYDSGNVDSGFLSGANLVSSELNLESAEHDPELRESAPVALEPMRADSGVDLGLSESLSQLTLKQVTLNPLGNNKVQSEPTIELTPLRTKVIGIDEPRKVQNYQQPLHKSESEAKQFNREPWELYYMQDDEGDTQLHIAIVQGFLEAALSLIRMAPHPCLLNIVNDDGQSPLHLSVLTHQPRIARRLILAGATPALRNTRGNTALHLACASGDLACCKALTDPLSPMERSYLVPGRRIPVLPQNLEQRNYDGEMCLHVAAAGGQVEIVRLLLRLGADLEAREGTSGRTALHLAVERGCRSVLTFLLHECRPCLDAPTYAGITAYQIASCVDVQLARELVRLGATPEPLPETDSEGSDDENLEDAPYLPALAQLRQSVGVRA